MNDITIYHNPACGTSRNVLALIRNTGEQPTVIEYLRDPPDRATLKQLIAAMGMPVRELLRRKGTPYDELGLDDPRVDRRAAARLHAGASGPHQPPDRGDAARHAAVPALRGRARPAAAPARRVRSPRKTAKPSSTRKASVCANR
jgi:arsenate reductase (glutaredoxin)